MHVRSQALAGLALLLSPHGVQAWADGPSCGVLQQGDASFAEAPEDEGEMCAPGVPHLLRSSSLDACPPMSGRDVPEDLPAVARRALERARKLDEAGRYEEALLNLRVVEAALPRIADHVAVMRAELHAAHGDHARAALAYRECIDASPSIELRASARVGYVKSLLRAGDEHAEEALAELLRRYPQLPEAPTLRLELARHRELTGETKSAIALYREIDLSHPGYPMAQEARERLAILAGAGEVVPAYSESELLSRTERLIRSGPVEQARATVMELRTRPFSRVLLGQRDALIARFDELEQRRYARIDAKPAQLAAEAAAAESTDPALVELTKQLARPQGEKQLAKLRPMQLMAHLERAARARSTTVVDALVSELARRSKSVSTELRFEGVTIAAGSASEGVLIALCDTLLGVPTVEIGARYHRARALERAGRRDEALTELRRVMSTDGTPTRFYATWAEQRLRELAQPGECRGAGLTSECNRAAIEASLAALESSARLRPELAIARLDELSRVHGDAYPWLARALDLVRMNELERATDELHETYLAYRFVARRGSLRAGREAVYRGAPIARVPTDVALHRARLRLDVDARAALAEVASALGDWGTAVDFGGPAFAEQHPEPYAREVASAARKYGLDPDLLFAVMRVESVFQHRIISHAGAIGLMQIMPRTGRLIADQLGVREMTATDLLDPRTSIEFSAWYLSSLITRMEGRLPLAIASYNGGPHNVRAWIRDTGTHTPLDAFLERIPFRETKRYVRRVLGYYATYKAQRGQRIDLMAIQLPGDDRPSAVSF